MSRKKTILCLKCESDHFSKESCPCTACLFTSSSTKSVPDIWYNSMGTFRSFCTFLTSHGNSPQSLTSLLNFAKFLYSTWDTWQCINGGSLICSWNSKASWWLIAHSRSCCSPNIRDAIKRVQWQYGTYLWSLHSS